MERIQSGVNKGVNLPKNLAVSAVSDSTESANDELTENKKGITIGTKKGFKGFEGFNSFLLIH